jgi:hypothetical protein
MPEVVSTFMEDLVSLFEGAGYDLQYGTNLFKGPKAKIPESTPGPFVSIIRSGGLGSEGTHNSLDVPAYERPSAQIVCRAVNYDDAELMAKQLHALLWKVQNQFINGTWWRQLNVRSEPFDLPVDEKGRPRVAFNIDCVKRVSPASS